MLLHSVIPIGRNIPNLKKMPAILDSPIVPCEWRSQGLKWNLGACEYRHTQNSTFHPFITILREQHFVEMLIQYRIIDFNQNYSVFLWPGNGDGCIDISIAVMEPIRSFGDPAPVDSSEIWFHFLSLRETGSYSGLINRTLFSQIPSSKDFLKWYSSLVRKGQRILSQKKIKTDKVHQQNYY